MSGDRFEWDRDKAAANLRKHEVDFRMAALIFQDWTLTREDDRQDYGERRFVSIGLAADDCFVVVWTFREDRIRIISAWKGGQDEREQYHQHVSGRDH